MRRIGNVVAMGLVVLGLWNVASGGIVVDFSIPDIRNSCQGIEGGTDIVTDSLGYVYVVGRICPPSPEGSAYVAKFYGSEQIWSRNIGGQRTQASGIALDSAGNVYVTGSIELGEDIATPNGYQTSHSASSTAYLLKLDSDGNVLYGTYIYQDEETEGRGVAVDSSGAAVVVGNISKGGDNYGWLARIDTSGNFQPFKRTFGEGQGGLPYTNAWGVASGSLGSVWVGGQTNNVAWTNSGYPLCGRPNNGMGACLLHVNADMMPYQNGPAPAKFACPEYLLGAVASSANRVRVIGNFVFIAGDLTNVNEFVGIFDSTNSTFSSRTFGGSPYNFARGVAVDPLSLDIWTTGTTNNSTFPTAGVPFQGTNQGGWDATVSKFPAALSALDYSSYLGGPGTDDDTLSPRFGGIATDPWGAAYVTGISEFGNFPQVCERGNGPCASSAPGGFFLTRFCDPAVCTATPTIVSSCLVGNAVEFSADYGQNPPAGAVRGPWRWSFFRGNAPIIYDNPNPPSYPVCYGPNQPANCVGSARGQSASFTFPEGTEGYTARLESCCQKFTDFPLGIGVAISSVSPAFGSVGTSVTITGTGFTSASTVFVSTPACKTAGGTTIPYSATITASNFGTYPQTLTFTLPSGICANPGGYDVTVTSNTPLCAEPSQATAYNAFVLAAPGRSTLSRTFGSTSGGTQIHVYNGGTCDYTNTTVLTFGSVDCTVTTDTALPCRMTLISANDLLVTTPSILESAPVTMSITGGGCAFLAPDNQFEFVQYGFSTDESTNANTMALFRSGENPDSFSYPLATDERHAIDGRPFPSIPISAISDVDLVAQSSRKLLVVESGKTVRLWSVGGESFSQTYPATSACPPLSYWSPKRVAADPDGTIAYVLHRQTSSQFCPAIVPEVPEPINLLRVTTGGISLYDRADTGASVTDYELEVADTSDGAGYPVDAQARLTSLTATCPSPSYDGNIHKWQNAGFIDGLTSPPSLPLTNQTGWKSRYLVVTQSSFSGDKTGSCPKKPCPAIIFPIVLAVYDLNPFVASNCSGSNPPKVTISAINPHYLKKRAVVFLGRFGGKTLPDGTHYEIGLSLSGANSNDLLVAAPLSGKLLTTTLTNILTLGDQARTSANNQSLEGDLELPDSNFIDLEYRNPGALPTSVVVMADPNTDTEFAYVALAGTTPNQIQKRLASAPTTVDRTGSLNDSAGGTSLVFPTAIAARDQRDKVFTANFANGSISPIPGGTAQMTGPSVPVGTNVRRIAIQSESCPTCKMKQIDGELSDADPSEFDSPPHQMALLNLIRALDKVVTREQASPSAVDAQVQAALNRANQWIVNPDLASSVRFDLVDAGSLYRQEVATGH